MIFGGLLPTVIWKGARRDAQSSLMEDMNICISFISEFHFSLIEQYQFLCMPGVMETLGVGNHWSQLYWVEFTEQCDLGQVS